MKRRQWEYDLPILAALIGDQLVHLLQLFLQRTSRQIIQESSIWLEWHSINSPSVHKGIHTLFGITTTRGQGEMFLSWKITKIDRNFWQFWQMC